MKIERDDEDSISRPSRGESAYLRSPPLSGGVAVVPSRRWTCLRRGLAPRTGRATSDDGSRRETDEAGMPATSPRRSPNFLRIASMVPRVGLPLSVSIWYRALVDRLHIAAKVAWSKPVTSSRNRRIEVPSVSLPDAWPCMMSSMIRFRCSLLGALISTPIPPGVCPGCSRGWSGPAAPLLVNRPTGRAML